MFLLLLPFVAAEEDYGVYSSVDLKFTMDSEIVATSTSSSYDIEYIKGEVSFFPRKDERQDVKILNLISEGQTGVDAEYARFYWEAPEKGTHEYAIESSVRVKNHFYDIGDVKFPINNLNSEVLDYTEPTKNIDLNADIENQARELISGEDNLFAAVYNVAEWTRNNIEYNLSSLTAEVLQPSSWVLENKQGVCDELTNLFISMLRSVGIPARFVSGMVYTNLDNSFGNHGWAEVYFPGYGWIPYDVTFGQYGWIDPSHLKLKEGKDSGSPSAEYSWRADEVDMKLKDLNTKIEVAGLGQKVDVPIEFSVSPLRKSAGFGSFVPLEVRVKNLRNSYFVANLFVVKAPGLLEENSKRVLLEPNEEKIIHWVIVVPEDLDSNYVYTAVLGVEDSFGTLKESNLKYSSEGKPYSKEQALAVVESYFRKEDKPVTHSIGLTCRFEKEFYYSNETAKLSCLVKNISPAKKTFEVCHRLDCLDSELEVGESETLNFFSDAHIGGRLIVSAEADDGIKYDYVNLEVIQLPEISIVDFEPKSIGYWDMAKISFTLSTSEPIRNVEIDTGFGKFKVPDFDRETSVRYNVAAKALIEGAKLTVTYEDAKGAKYVEKIAFSIDVVDKPWYIRMKLWFNGLF